ncbi:MAG: hypothetical protein ABIF85_01410 [Nanoarchaeota archaeon]|nr:hypothetical protein [Nanoarchaeota archaeon]MBU4299763.1 hypothetical protein [Nanoarchaeota archaeon]MBU4452577.1 hypothetical protein [Nanoarchaeota archaeon]MCG2723542.1 hypothetical protein [archaeon]
MMAHIIAIAGGTGSGKSTLAYGLLDKFPELIEIVHFDDYQKLEPNVPIHQGMRNWDHPDAIDFDQLIHDLSQLRNGNDVQIMTKDKKLNPGYEISGRIRTFRIIHSKKIIILESYLALWNESVRKLIDYSIFLDTPTRYTKAQRKKDSYLSHKAFRVPVIKTCHTFHIHSDMEYSEQ